MVIKSSQLFFRDDKSTLVHNNSIFENGIDIGGMSMEKNTITNLNNEAMDNNAEVVKCLQETVSKATDVSSEIDKIISFTPKSGYDKKIELIAAADDLTTKEKIAAINEAEAKYSQDLADNAETYNRLLWTKVGTVLGVTAGIVFMVSSPSGRKVAKNILKKIA